MAFAFAICSSACVDPKGTFDEFEGRVVDGGNGGSDGSGNLNDISGQFLTGLVPAFAPNSTLRFIGTVEFTDNGDGATANFSFQPITAAKCVGGEANAGQPVGDPLVINDVAISATGTFTASVTNARVEAMANDVSCGLIRADINLEGIIQNEDLFCGGVSGMVNSPSPASLDNSTFGAIRITEGTVGQDLPESLGACPDSGGDADAG